MLNKKGRRLKSKLLKLNLCRVDDPSCLSAEIMFALLSTHIRYLYIFRRFSAHTLLFAIARGSIGPRGFSCGLSESAKLLFCPPFLFFFFFVFSYCCPLHVQSQSNYSAYSAQSFVRRAIHGSSQCPCGTGELCHESQNLVKCLLKVVA